MKRSVALLASSSQSHTLQSIQGIIIYYFPIPLLQRKGVVLVCENSKIDRICKSFFSFQFHSSLTLCFDDFFFCLSVSLVRGMMTKDIHKQLYFDLGIFLQGRKHTFKLPYNLIEAPPRQRSFNLFNLRGPDLFYINSSGSVRSQSPGSSSARFTFFVVTGTSFAHYLPCRNRPKRGLFKKYTIRFAV